MNKDLVTQADMSAQNLEITQRVNQPVQSRRRSQPTIWKVLTQARRIFDAQLEKDNRVKLKCIENFMPTYQHDSSRFWSEYMEQVGKLLNSRHYTNEAAQLGCDAFYLAEHIVFLGSTMINKVLKNGIRKTIGNDYQLYKERLSPAEVTEVHINNMRTLFNMPKQLPERTE